MRVLGVREQAPALVAAASEVRMRAFTKLTQVYDDTRRAVGYLRAPQGDADKIAPTLYPGRPKRRPSADPQPSPGAGAPAPVSATPTPPAASPTPELPSVSHAIAANVPAKDAQPTKSPFAS